MRRPPYTFLTTIIFLHKKRWDRDENTQTRPRCTPSPFLSDMSGHQKTWFEIKLCHSEVGETESVEIGTKKHRPVDHTLVNQHLDDVLQ